MYVCFACIHMYACMYVFMYICMYCITCVCLVPVEVRSGHVTPGARVTACCKLPQGADT